MDSLTMKLICAVMSVLEASIVTVQMLSPAPGDRNLYGECRC